MTKSILKRVLPVLLSALMLFSVMPMQAFAAETSTQQTSSEPSINDFESFVMYVGLLEELAGLYVGEHPGVDPLNLVIKYIRTGVDRYNSGSWEIMAGKEDVEFADYVKMMEDALNETAPSEDMKIYVSSLKKCKQFYAS